MKNHLVDYNFSTVLKLILIAGLIVGLIGACANQPKSSGAASVSNGSNSSESVKSLNTRLDRLEQTVNKLESSLGSSNQPGSEDAQNRAILISTLREEMEQQIAGLRRKVEQLEFQNRKGSGQFDRMARDLINLRKDMDEYLLSGAINKPISMQGKPTRNIPTAPVSFTTPQDKARAQEWFKQGVKAYQQQQFAQAADFFYRFRKADPEAQGTDDALWMQANSRFELREWQSAALLYQDFITQYPSHPNRTEAKWKLAESLDRSGESGLAIDMYQEIAGERSQYQTLAKQRLQRYDTQP